MTERELSLEAKEKTIRQRAEVFTEALEAFRRAEQALRQSVDDYKQSRAIAQRKIWVGQGRGWCHGCDRFHDQEKLSFLYTEGSEWRGSHYTEYKTFIRQIRSFCPECAENMLSYPRGGENKFQCYKVSEEDDKFLVFITGHWIPLADPENVTVLIERPFIPKDEFQVGKEIDLQWFSGRKLEIGGEKIF